jgi:hypothetical protein
VAGIAASFDQELHRQGRSARTREAYLEDVRAFAAWWQHTYRTPMQPADVSPLDMADYKK